MLGLTLARKNANALLAKSPVSNFGKSDVVVVGRAGENDNFDRVDHLNDNCVSFSSVRVRGVQDLVDADVAAPDADFDPLHDLANSRSLANSRDSFDSVVDSIDLLGGPRA